MIQFVLSHIIKKKKKKVDISSTNIVDENLIPYVGYYDKNTIITKNGELLQTIRITGFSNSMAVSELSSLRDAVRNSIGKNIKDNSVALWFNTIRRKKDISIKAEANDKFSNDFSQKWRSVNDLKGRHVNELYITVVIEGLDSSILNIGSFIRSLSYKLTQNLHSSHLEAAHKKLSEIVSNILEDVNSYGAKLLGMQEWNGVLFSEHLRFFGKITNLYEERYPVVCNDFSSELATHKIAFGDRELEVLGYNNKHYGAMMSLKEYQEISNEFLDILLQQPFEFILTQSFDFYFNKKELEPFKYQDYILNVSKEEELKNIVGLDLLLEDKEDLATEYGKLQTTMMIISDTKEQLENDVKLLYERFTDLGQVLVRENIFMEHCFLSQMPGNFKYLCRQKLIDSSRIAGFAALHNYPGGSQAGNHWGPAIAILDTVLDTPYFFNFHNGSLGHTLILGPKDSGKTTLVNFLLCQANRIDHRLFYFDFNSKSECFIEALQDSLYLTLGSKNKDQALGLNPIASLKKSPQNLKKFFESLVVFDNDAKNYVNEIKLIPEFVQKIAASRDINNFSTAIEVFNNEKTPNIYKRLAFWNSKKLSHIFGFDGQDNIDFSKKKIGLNLSQIINHKPILVPVVSYLLDKFQASLDGSPTILVLNDAWQYLENKFLGGLIRQFLEKMKEMNCVVIFVESDLKLVNNSKILEDISTNIASEIYMPDSDLGQSYQQIFDISEEVVGIIKVMDVVQRNFLFKNSEDSIIFSLNLEHIPEYNKIFSANKETIQMMREIKAKNSENWLEELQSKLA